MISFVVTFVLQFLITLPFNLTHPLLIKRSASRLEHKPELAIFFAILSLIKLSTIIKFIIN